MFFVWLVFVDHVENWGKTETDKDFYWPEECAKDEKNVEVGFVFSVPVACCAEFAAKGFEWKEYPAKAGIFSRFHDCLVPHSVVFVGEVRADHEIAQNK